MKFFISLLYLLLIFLPQNLLAQPPKLSHGVAYRSHVDIENYLVSEKLDGVRAYWNGTNLLSRKGNIFHAPKWFIASLPSRMLDGELWIARGAFEKTVSTVRKHRPVDSEWRQVKYMLFELPDASGDFSQRYHLMQEIVKTTNVPHLQVINQKNIKSAEELTTLLEKVVQQGGEGLMLHRKNSFYKTGRTNDIIKVKKRYSAEAVVIKHLPGKGKFSGMLGALIVENKEGRQFRIGTGFSEQQRRIPPDIGSTITYSYYGFTAKGVPRFPSFLRKRANL